MKKVVLLGFCLALFSCSKNENSLQIESAKKELLNLQVKEYELEKYQFIVTELFDKDVYNMISKKYEENSLRLKKTRKFEESIKEQNIVLEYLSKPTSGKTFFKVQAVRIEGDTLNNKIIYLDDKNNVIDNYNIK